MRLCVTGYAAARYPKSRAPFNMASPKERPRSLCGFAIAVRLILSCSREESSRTNCYWKTYNRSSNLSILRSGPTMTCLLMAEESVSGRPHWPHSATSMMQSETSLKESPMHELSIAMSIVDMAQEEAERRKVHIGAVH